MPLNSRIPCRFTRRWVRPHICRSTRHRGTTLIEVLVAMPVIAIVGVIAITLLLAAYRQARFADGTLTASRELRHASLVMASELRPMQPADLVAYTDTSIEFESLVASGVVCDVQNPARTIDLLPVDAVEPILDPARTAWIMPAQNGDRVAAWLAPVPPSLAPIPFVATLRAVVSSSACAGSILRATSDRAVRLELTDSLPTQLAEGTPVRITRRTRYNLYRASDGLWYVGRRTRTGLKWDVIQPVVGPLSSAFALGLRFTLLDSMGAAVTPGPSVAAVRVSLRALRRGTTPPVLDSSAIEIALRGRNDD